MADNDWTVGYRRALRDFEYLAGSRGIITSEITSLLRDIDQDALVIEHEQKNKLQKRRYSAAREAGDEAPLFPLEEPQRMLTRPR